MQDTESPARFARLVAQAAPNLRFDAWAHHPYPRNDLDLSRRAAAVAGGRLHRPRPLRRRARALVRPRVGAAVGDGDRLPHEPADHGRGAVLAAGGVARARARAGAGAAGRAHARVVRLPRRAGPAVAERPARPPRPREARARAVRGSLAAERARPPGRGRSGDASCTPSACPRSSCARIWRRARGSACATAWSRAARAWPAA